MRHCLRVGVRLMPVAGAAVMFGVAMFAAAADVRAADWNRIREGDHVEIECEWSSAGLRANEVDVRAAADGADVEIVAPVESVTPDVLRILGTDVRISRTTRAKADDGESMELSALRSGDWVEIDGNFADGVVTAHRVKRLGSTPRSIEIEGPVQTLGREAHAMIVAGMSVLMDADVSVRGLPVFVPRVIDDDDVESSFLRGFDGRLVVGGRVTGAVEPEKNFDLNSRRAGDQVRSDWSTELQADARFSRTFDAFAKAGYRGRQILVDDEGDETDRTDASLQQAWVLWRPTRPIAIQVGRQDFDERREWLYDETLDAVRVHLQAGSVRAEASVSTRWNTDATMLRDWTNWMLLARREVAKRWDVEAYGIHRRRTDETDRPTWVGVRSHGRLRSGMRHWVELARLSGLLDGADRDAWAFDAGIRVRLERRTRLSVVAAWAVGSGGDGPAGTFRQTGLQDNNDKFSGVSSFKYYGELFEPELANLSVGTLGTGLRPTRHTSLDVVLHNYAQRRAAPRLERSNLETRPRGISADIGREWNVIVALEEIPGLDLEYVFAWFDPGSAFDENAESAIFHQLSVRYGF